MSVAVQATQAIWPVRDSPHFQCDQIFSVKIYSGNVKMSTILSTARPFDVLGNKLKILSELYIFVKQKTISTKRDF